MGGADQCGWRPAHGRQADDLSDDDIRRVLAVLAADYNPDGMSEEVAAQARRFAETMKVATSIKP